MKLLIDMNLSPRWIDVLSSGGFEALHWESVGAGTTPDPQIMLFAVAHGYTIFTNDLDFGISLALTNAANPSVIQLRCEDVRPEIAGVMVLDALATNVGGIERGALVTVGDQQVRCRLLPMKITTQ